MPLLWIRALLAGPETERRMAEALRSKTVVYASLAGDVLVAASKFAAAAFTGSASMIAEGVHSIIDAGNDALLLYGYRRAQLGPDRRHPLGYGRELYFWSFVVALLMFTVGTGISILEGATRIMAPSAIRSPGAIYLVLGASAVFEGVSRFVAWKTFRVEKGEAG